MEENIKSLYKQFFKGERVREQREDAVLYSDWRRLELHTGIAYVWQEEKEWKLMFERFMGPDWKEPELIEVAEVSSHDYNWWRKYLRR